MNSYTRGLTASQPSKSRTLVCVYKCFHEFHASVLSLFCLIISLIVVFLSQVCCSLPMKTQRWTHFTSQWVQTRVTVTSCSSSAAMNSYVRDRSWSSNKYRVWQGFKWVLKEMFCVFVLFQKAWVYSKLLFALCEWVHSNHDRLEVVNLLSDPEEGECVTLTGSLITIIITCPSQSANMLLSWCREGIYQHPQCNQQFYVCMFV